jgi:hypothetical protein
VHKSTGKFLASIFWYQRAVLLSLLLHLKDILKEKVLTQLALATQKKLAYQDIQILDHPPYSPDLVPSDSLLFPGMKNLVRWTIF